MIQDIAPSVFHNAYVSEVTPKESDTVFAFGERSVLCRMDSDKVSFPSVGELQAAGLDAKKCRYLFRIDGRQYFLYQTYSEEVNARLQAKLDAVEALSGYNYESTRILRKVSPKTECFAAETAYHLYTWYRNTQFCGRCGSRTEHSRTERAKVCPVCGNTIYPRIMPACIIGVTRGDKILVSRYAGREYKGVALLAGFTEFGETAEETVAREVLEEVGLHVHNVRYFASQPWGFDSDLLLGFYCDADPDEEIKLDEEELSRAEFISRDEIGQENADLSLTATMIMNFKEKGYEGTFRTISKE